MNELEDRLAGLVDEEYREGMVRAVPTTWKIRGVRVPELKRVAKGLTPASRTVDDYREILEFLDDAFSRDDRELTLIGINMLMSYKRFFDESLAEKSQSWISRVEDWEMCDNLSYLLMAELLLRGFMDEGDLLYLRDHDNLFARRAYIVCRVIPLRKGIGDTEKHLKDISYFVDSKEKYIVKALSWALREATKSSPEEVERFLADYGDGLHPSVIREVKNKLETGKKN